jgi:hypothetical protein
VKSLRVVNQPNKISWNDVSQALGRTARVCKVRYKRIREVLAGKAARKGRFTPEEVM